MSNPTRILQINTYHHLRGGDSRVMFETAAHLRARGHDVRHFAMQHADNVEDRDAHHFAPELDYPRMQAEGGLRNAWQVARSSISNPDARRALAGLLDEWAPDVAHLHSVMHHLTASVVLELRSRGIPIAWTLHDYKSVCPTTRLLRDGHTCHDCTGGRFLQATRHRCKRGSLPASLITTIELALHRRWRVYEDADLLIAPSRFLADTVQSMGLRARRLEVLPNFVDTSAYEPAVGRDRGYVLFVGRLSHEKGLPTLLEAMDGVAGIDLRVAGTGEMGDALRARAGTLCLDNVHFEGYSSGDALATLYRNARAVVVPSEWYENCPMVVLEAFAYGKPVIGTALGGLIDLVDPGVTGELVPAGDVSAWRRAMQDLADRPQYWHELGDHALEAARSRFDVQTHMDLLEAWFDQLSPNR